MKRIDAVRISGGEPFLRNDLAEIMNIIDEKSRPSVIHVTTNGLMTEELIDALRKTVPIEKLHLKISIDYAGEEHDRARGVPRAYEKAMNTVKEAAELRKRLGFYIGVNQAVLDVDGIRAYSTLKDLLMKLQIGIHSYIAHDASVGLYDDDSGSSGPPKNSFKPFGEFPEAELYRFLKALMKDTSMVCDRKEAILRRYHLKGLMNRMRGIRRPNPRCVALNSHLRILPNGDVPVCLYNPSVVGNLRKNPLEEVWFANEVKQFRQWVRQCSGCWVFCEVPVSAIYTGDIWRGLF